MIEIMGGNLDKAFEELGIMATKTYQQTKGSEYQEVHQVWELIESDFEKISNFSEDDWHDDWGWWRSAIGSNMCNPTTIIKINGEDIKAWYEEERFNEYIKDYLNDIMECNPNLNRGEEEQKLIKEYFEEELEYSNLLEYFCDELGASQPRNVCALAVDLAQMNNMKMSELFQNYQG